MLIDESGIVIEWNYSLEKITGISKKETIGKPLREINFNILSEDGKSPGRTYKLVATIEEIIEKKGTKNFNKTFEDEIIGKNGKYMSLQSVVYPIITEKGIMIGSVIRDITEKKKIEKQNMVFSRAIESSASGVVLFDFDYYNVQYVNKTTVQMLNANINSDINGRPIFDFICEEDAERIIKQYIPELRVNGEWLGEIKLKRLDGELLDVYINCSYVKDESNDPVFLLAIINDISQRKKHEEALIESEQRFRFVVDNIKEIIFQTDAEGNWLFLNPAWEEITGFSRKESIGKLFLEYVHPEDREKNTKEFNKLICFEKDYCRHIIRYLTKSGGFKWIEVFAKLNFNDNGDIIGTSGSLYDITEKFQAEIDVKEALKKEIELNELKSRFVSTVSHEFRTPLTSILASAELILRYNDKWGEDKKINTVKRIQKSAIFMNEMVSGVLDLNRAESGRLVFNPRETELISCLKEIIEEVKPLATEKHKLIFSAGEESIMGGFDEKMLKSVMINLLSNAIKYSPNGGKIKLTVERESNSVLLGVSDEGIGIPADDKANLFIPFFRAKNIGNISGTGLGLSIVKKNIELQSGKISFTSESGKGTSFVISLPINN